ncbi:MAG TPA: hypothetical protein VIF12_04385 [Micavibrio sp.]
MNDGKANGAARILFFFAIMVAVMVMRPLDAFAIITPLGGLPYVSPTVGGAMANTVVSVSSIPSLLAGGSYLFGLLILILGIVKFKDHVLSPTQVPLSDGVKRMVVAGALFSLPMIIEATVTTLTGGGHLPFTGTFFHTSTTCWVLCGGAMGLDDMMVNLLNDIWLPMSALVSAFSYLAGLILIIIGISRLLKTAQEGPRGPSGVGTIMTFLIGGVLISLDSMMRAFGVSLFSNVTNPFSLIGVPSNYALMSFSTGNAAADGRVLNVVSTCLAFMTLVGWVSFVRGWFIVRGVAEGDNQASLMAGMTHIFGGALAVNLGPLLNFVQNTFGITGFGITFT